MERASRTVRGGPYWTSCCLMVPRTQAQMSVKASVSRLSSGLVTGVCGHGKAGANITQHARVVIGADGRHSLVV
jgi:hypothetical protein